MLSVFDRIKNALANGKTLSKTELFTEASMPNSESNRALFQILVQNKKLIPIGQGRGRKYCLPLIFEPAKLPSVGTYTFRQKGDGKIIFTFDQEEPITLQSYEEFVIFIKGRLTNG